MKSNINNLCKSSGTTLYALAKKTGLTDRALYKYEKNGLEKAQFGCMVRIAKELNCSLEDLYE